MRRYGLESHPCEPASATLASLRRSPPDVGKRGCSKGRDYRQRGARRDAGPRSSGCQSMHRQNERPVPRIARSDPPPPSSAACTFAAGSGTRSARASPPPPGIRPVAPGSLGGGRLCVPGPALVCQFAPCSCDSSGPRQTLLAARRSDRVRPLLGHRDTMLAGSGRWRHRRPLILPAREGPQGGGKLVHGKQGQDHGACQRVAFESSKCGKLKQQKWSPLPTNVTMATFAPGTTNSGASGCPFLPSLPDRQMTMRFIYL